MTLPDGFVLDQQPTGLPDGFVIDQHPQRVIPSDINIAANLVGNSHTLLAPFGKLLASATDNEPLESKAVRATQGAIDPAIGIAQAVPHAISYASSLGGTKPNKVSEMANALAAQQDSFAQKENAGYEAMRSADGMEGFDGYRMAGNIASPINLIPGKIAGSLAPATTLAGKMAQGAGIGAMYGLTAPATDPNKSYADQKISQAETGAAFGGGAPLLGETLARMVKPNISQDAQKLMDEGVRLTPGQLYGGALHRLEDAATSIPLIGDAIKGAQGRGIEDFNVAVANRALEPLGEEVPDNVSAGHELVSYVKNKLSDAYDDVLPNLTGKADPQYVQDMGNLRSLAQNMPPDRAKQFENIIQNEVDRRMSPNGSWTGESLKEIESTLGRQATGYGKSQSMDERQLGDALSEAQSVVRQMIQRNNPDYADRLQAINQGYSNFARMRDAAAMQGSKEGVFTAPQLSNAVRRNDFSVRKGAFATGNALMQDLSGAGKSVLPSTVPDSGSIGRAIVPLLLAHELSPATIPVAAAGAALYSRPGVALAETLLANRPEGAQELADAIRKVSSPADLAKILGGYLSSPSTPGNAVAVPQ